MLQKWGTDHTSLSKTTSSLPFLMYLLIVFLPRCAHFRGSLIHPSIKHANTRKQHCISYNCPMKALHLMSILPTISHWLASATERAVTRTISPGQGNRVDTAEMVTRRTGVTFQLPTTAGCIFAKRSVLTDLRPGVVLDFLLCVFHTNPTLQTVVLRLNNAEIENVRGGLIHVYQRGSTTNRTLGTTLAKGMVIWNGIQRNLGRQYDSMLVVTAPGTISCAWHTVRVPEKPFVPW